MCKHISCISLSLSFFLPQKFSPSQVQARFLFSLCEAPIAGLPKQAWEKGDCGKVDWGSLCRVLLNPSICIPESLFPLTHTMTDFFDPKSVQFNYIQRQYPISHRRRWYLSDLFVLGRTWGFNCSVYRLLSFNHAMCFQFLPYLELLWYCSFFFNPLRRIDLASPQYLHYKQFISLCSLVITLCFPQVIWNLISYSFLLLSRV